MRKLLLCFAAAGLLAPMLPATAEARPGYYGYGYGHDRVQRERRECRRELRRADSRREYRRELRECRREISRARYERDWRRDNWRDRRYRDRYYRQRHYGW